MKRHLIIFLTSVTLSAYATESNNLKKRKNAAATDQSKLNEKKLILKSSRKGLIAPLANQKKELSKRKIVDDENIKWLEHELAHHAVLSTDYSSLKTVKLTIARSDRNGDCSIKETLSMAQNLLNGVYTGAHTLERFNNKGGLVLTVHFDLIFQIAELLKNKIKN